MANRVKKDSLKTIKAWLILVRIEHAVMSMAGVAVGLWLTAQTTQRALAFPPILNGGPIPSPAPLVFIPLPLLLLSLAVPFFINLASFAFNDYVDIEADKKNGHKERPLVSGALAPSAAFATSAICYAIGTAAGWLINPACGLLAAIFAILSIAYNAKLKDLPLIGNAYIALSMAIAFPFGAMVMGYSISSLPASIVWLSAGAFLAGLGREIIKSVQDMEGDKAARGSRHLPIVIGAKNSLHIASICAVCYCAVILGLAAQPMHWNILAYGLLALSGLAYLMISVELLKAKVGPETLERMRHVSLYALMLALLAIALTYDGSLLVGDSPIVTSCRALSSAGWVYVLANDVGIKENYCLNITAANVTLDCAGHHVIGTGNRLANINGVIGTVGIFSTGANTTIKNCFVDGSSTSIDLKNSKNATIINNTLDAYEYGVSLEVGHTGSDYTTVANNTMYVHNVGLTGAVDIYACGHALVRDNLIYANGSPMGAAIFLHDSTGSSQIINNTIISNQTAILSYIRPNLTDNLSDKNVTSDAGNNTFLLNNITARIWVNDSQFRGEPNHYNNATVGNIYYFVNGTPSWEVFDLADTNSDHWADSGAALPFNSTTVGGNFTGAAKPQDHHPYAGHAISQASGNSRIAPSPAESSSVLSCRNLSSANQNYTLGADLSMNEGYCLNITEANISLDCIGHHITGTGNRLAFINRISGTVGIFSTGVNTTIKNCYIDGFSTAIDLKNSDAFISNNTLDVYEYGVSLEVNILGNTSANYSTVNGNTMYVHNVNWTGAVDIFSCGHITVSGNLIYSNGTVNGGSIYCHSSYGSNLFINNTIISNQTAMLVEFLPFSNNTFLHNNITALIWVNDSHIGGEPNYYNNATAGNIYYFVNGTPSWQVFDLIDTNSDRWADSGSARPFNSTTTGGRFTGSANPQDWFPWTGRTASNNKNHLSYPSDSTSVTSCRNLSSSNQNYTLGADLSMNEGYCLNITEANISLDCIGHHITGTGNRLAFINRISGTVGIFSTGANTTIKNCYIDGFSTAIDLKNSTNASISNNTMDAYEYGVSLEFGETGSDYAVLRGNTIYAHNVNLSGAIDIFHCGHAAVEGNLIYSNGSAIGAAIFLHESGGSNFFFNNTIISNQTAVFSDNPDAGNNTYLLNNITALVWVNDNQVSSEKSHYNNATAGSIYYFVNGTPVWEVFDVIDTNSDNWADAGSAWPFNATTTGGRFIGVGLPQDRHPWTGKTKAK